MFQHILENPDQNKFCLTNGEFSFGTKNMNWGGGIVFIPQNKRLNVELDFIAAAWSLSTNSAWILVFFCIILVQPEHIFGFLTLKIGFADKRACLDSIWRRTQSLGLTSPRSGAAGSSRQI